MSTRILIPAIFVLLFGTSRIGSAVLAVQEESKKSPDFSFTCTQNNQEFVLKTRLSYWTGERDLPISGAAVTYYNMVGEESSQLEVVRTDMDGVAVYQIEKGSDKLLGMDDIYTFKSLFKGNSEYERSEDFAAVKPLQMRLEFIEIDSVRTIVAEAFETDLEGNRIPLEDADIYFYAQRSFSLLPVGEEWFVGGQAQVNFPASLPGDPEGNLTIVARIEDHELFGNVEAVAVKDWGQAMPQVLVEKRRGLGDTDAPLWMVYTLIVLLSVVWFHYLYVFYIMIKIKRLGRNQEVNYDTSEG